MSTEMLSPEMVNRLKKWQKIALWFSLVSTVLTIGVGITLIMLLHNESFRRSILIKAENSIQESTGARVEVRDFSLRLSNLSLDLYNVIVHGTEANARGPLLQVDHLQVGLTVDSLLNKKWHVRDLIVDRPIVRLAVDRAGENNLPKPQKKDSSSSSMNIFDLAIRELRLNQGEIYYNDQKTPLEADLHTLTLSANYNPAQNKYSGELSYNNGKVVYGDYAPIAHTLQAKIRDHTADIYAGKT